MTTSVEAAVKLANERIDAWLAKMESGEIKPLNGMLTNPDGSKMCCLGVLCEVSDLKRVSEGFIGPVTGNTLTTWPAKCIANSVGIDAHGYLGTRGDERWVIPTTLKAEDYNNASTLENLSLSELNDSRKEPKDFGHIVEIIKLNRERMVASVREKAEYQAKKEQQS